MLFHLLLSISSITISKTAYYSKRSAIHQWLHKTGRCWCWILRRSNLMPAIISTSLDNRHRKCYCTPPEADEHPLNAACRHTIRYRLFTECITGAQ